MITGVENTPRPEQPAPTLTRVGLVVHGGRAEAAGARDQVYSWCAAHDVDCVDIDVWHEHQRRNATEEIAAAGDPDLIVTLGGDGTFLRGARLAAANDALLLGVDLGRVGFLTEVPATSLATALDAVHKGAIGIDRRMLLTVRVSRPLEVPQDMESWASVYGRGPLLPKPKIRHDAEAGDEWGIPLNVTAVNDVVVEKLSRDRQVSVGVYVSGRLLASYSADALLVATPTGSTAYSFAAGGPVLSPHMDAVVFTPIAAHMTFDRSIVAAPDEPVALRVLPHSGPAVVSVDGQLRGVLDPGDWIGVFRAPERIRLIRLHPTDFYGRLRERFRLTDAPATAPDGPASPFFRPDTPIPPDLAGLRLPPPAAAR